MLDRTLSRSRLGLVLGLVGSLVVTGLLAVGPAHAQKIRPDFWGMHDAQWQTNPRVPVGAANLTTSSTYWNLVEQSPRNFYWGQLDLQVSSAESMQAQPMVVLGLSPKFHSTRPRAADYRDYMPRMRAWKRYVKKVGKRYGARLDYQIWPEPNIIQNWKGSVGQMAKLTAAASNVLDRVAPRAKVVSPALTLRMKKQRTWMVNYFKQSVGGQRIHRYVDVIAIDTFPEQTGTPEDSFKLMRKAKSQLARIGVRGVPFYNNEINYGVAGGGDRTRTDYPVDLQQSFVIRTYALSAAARMKRTYWLGWFKTNTMAVSLATKRGRKLQPGKSYGIVRSWMNGTSFKRCARARSGLWTCTMRAGTDEVRRIYWKPSGSQRVRLPRTRLRLENQEGGVRHDPPRRVRVNFRPIMVASRR